LPAPRRYSRHKKHEFHWVFAMARGLLTLKA
jgi:hypothetical protein